MFGIGGWGALNAANASPNALANASPNSRVGKIAIYAAEVGITQELIAELEAAQDVLDGLEEPMRDIEDIDMALDEARAQKSALEDQLADLNAALDGAEDPAAIQAQIDEANAALETTNTTISDLEQERADGEAYAAAEKEVERLEGEVEGQADTQRAALEDAANKEVTDEVEIAVQKLLGIYEEPEMDEVPVLDEDIVVSE